MPAWCTPTPRASARKIVWLTSESPIVGLSRKASPMSGVHLALLLAGQQPRRSARTSSIARSQPTRLKMK